MNIETVKAGDIIPVPYTDIEGDNLKRKLEQPLPPKLMTQDEYAQKVIKEMTSYGFDPDYILKAVKGELHNWLELKESDLKKQLADVRTEILRLSRA